jgi:hypothetical protein
MGHHFLLVLVLVCLASGRVHGGEAGQVQGQLRQKEAWDWTAGAQHISVSLSLLVCLCIQGHLWLQPIPSPLHAPGCPVGISVLPAAPLHPSSTKAHPTLLLAWQEQPLLFLHCFTPSA